MKKLFPLSLVTALLVIYSCSESKDEEPMNQVSEDSQDKPRIMFFEDTIYFNKSGSTCMAFLSLPSYEEIEVVNNNSWLSYSPFQYWDDIGFSSMTEFTAQKNYTNEERRGYVYFRYKESPYREKKELMDSLYVIQLTSDSVLTTDKEYSYDEYSHDFAIFTTYSDFESYLNAPWVKQTSHIPSNAPKTKFTFTIEPLPDEEDYRSTGLGFSQIKDIKSPIRNVRIEQKRAIIIDNKVNVMKIDTDRQLEISLSWGVTKKDLVFESSEPNVATISENGYIKALKEGNTLITVTSKDGKHITRMPLAVKKILNIDENNVQIGMGISITHEGIKFFVDIQNGSNKDIILERLIIKNLGETIYDESSESVLGTISAGQNKLIYFNVTTAQCQMDCELYYTLEGKGFKIGEDSGIVIQ